MAGASAAIRLELLRAAGAFRPPPRLPQPPRSILIIRPDHLGDLLMASPAVVLLRQLFPESRLTAWLGPWGEAVWRHDPNLDGIRLCAFPGFARETKTNPLAPYLLAVHKARALAGQFDAAINLRFDFWWGALTAALAGIPVAGYDTPECRPFLSLPVSYAAGRHEVDQNLALARAFGLAAGGRSLPEDGVDAPPLRQMSFPAGLPPAGLPAGAIAIHPGSGAAVKLWRDDGWIQVASKLAERAPVILTAGNALEEEAAKRIRAGIDAALPVQVWPRLELDQLAALYANCRLTLGVDSGPLHLARAVGTPTVALFGPTDPSMFGPHPQSAAEGARHEVVRLSWGCIPCRRLNYNQEELDFHLCVRLIDPERVLEAAYRVLGE